MGFQKADLRPAWQEIARAMVEVQSPYNDGYTGSACKKDLYLLKSWFNQAYDRLPKFADEVEWEQERLISILKKD